MSGNGQETREGQSPWGEALIAWAFDVLGDYLEGEDRDRLERLRHVDEVQRLAAFERCEESARVRALDALLRGQWHADLGGRVAELEQEIAASLAPDDLRELARTTLEGGHLRLIEQEELDPERRVSELERERRIADRVHAWLSQSLADTEKRDAREARDLERRLRALRRKLANHADEARLAVRLDLVFGRRLVLWFSRLTFFCLIFLLGLLVVDLFLPDDSPLKEPVVWIDTGVCLVFLWEFVVRLAFAPRRIRWFLRHFVTDFVPAIPFALFLAPEAAAGRSAADWEVFLRSVRLARFPLYAKYVRALKPLVALFRLAVFWMRGMDRVVKGLAPFLNRDFLLFEPAPSDPEEKSEDKPLVGVSSERRTTHGFERLSPEMRKEAAPALLERLAESLAAGSPVAVREVPGTRESVRAEAVIESLQALTPEDVETRLPETSVRSLGRLLRLMDIPPLRWLPVIGGVVRAGKGATHAERVAQAGRRVGDYAGAALGFVVGWADLAGVLTAPQVLDRISTALIRSTQRPAIRLLLFGGFFFVANAFLDFVLPRVSEAIGLGAILTSFVTTPLLVIGLACLLLQWLARWLKKIAGQASDRLLRSAEARFVNLLELSRWRSAEEDRQVLVERTLGASGVEASALSLEIVAAQQELQGRRTGGTRRAVSPLARRLALLLLDYQDGALLHPTDTKVAQQFLSNPDLWSLRQEHLTLGEREERRLEKLDLDSGGLFSGPCIWFDFVTHAIAVKVARLCSSYNLHLIPLDAIERASGDERMRHEALVSGEGELRTEPGVGRAFRGSRFHALHFLSESPVFLDEVRGEYGGAVVARLEADRRALIRELFGTRPLHELEPAKRSVNLFEFYEGRLGGGKVLLLPFKAMGMAMRLTGMLVGLAIKSAKEILDPRRSAANQRDTRASFAIARRKLRRMKKPLILEMIRLAAAVDPSYIGLATDGSGIEGRAPWEADIALVDPTPSEVHAIEHLRSSAAKRLLYAPSFIEHLGVQGDAPGIARIVAAVASDERGIASMIAAEYRARSWLYEASRGSEVPSGSLPPSRFLREAGSKRGWRLMLGHIGVMSRRERKHLEHAWRAREGDLRLVCAAFARAAPASPTEAAAELARKLVVARDDFLDRRRTLRAILALALQDLRHHESYVLDMGGYVNDRPSPAMPSAAREG